MAGQAAHGVHSAEGGAGQMAGVAGTPFAANAVWMGADGGGDAQPTNTSRVAPSNGQGRLGRAARVKMWLSVAAR